jgi:hypothetical protein
LFPLPPPLAQFSVYIFLYPVRYIYEKVYYFFENALLRIRFTLRAAEPGGGGLSRDMYEKDPITL